MRKEQKDNVEDLDIKDVAELINANEDVVEAMMTLGAILYV